MHSKILTGIMTNPFYQKTIDDINIEAYKKLYQDYETEEILKLSKSEKKDFDLSYKDKLLIDKKLKIKLNKYNRIWFDKIRNKIKNKERKLIRYISKCIFERAKPVTEYILK